MKLLLVLDCILFNLFQRWNTLKYSWREWNSTLELWKGSLKEIEGKYHYIDLFYIERFSHNLGPLWCVPAFKCHRPCRYGEDFTVIYLIWTCQPWDQDHSSNIPASTQCRATVGPLEKKNHRVENPILALL